MGIKEQFLTGVAAVKSSTFVTLLDATRFTERRRISGLTCGGTRVKDRLFATGSSAERGSPGQMSFR
jgi:hypothetical protein